MLRQKPLCAFVGRDQSFRQRENLLCAQCSLDETFVGMDVDLQRKSCAQRVQGLSPCAPTKQNQWLRLRQNATDWPVCNFLASVCDIRSASKYALDLVVCGGRGFQDALTLGLILCRAASRPSVAQRWRPISASASRNASSCSQPAVSRTSLTAACAAWRRSPAPHVAAGAPTRKRPRPLRGFSLRRPRIRSACRLPLCGIGGGLQGASGSAGFFLRRVIIGVSKPAVQYR